MASDALLAQVYRCAILYMDDRVKRLGEDVTAAYDAGCDDDFVINLTRLKMEAVRQREAFNKAWDEL